jgi:sugar phosphate isomerase/epimerase
MQRTEATRRQFLRATGLAGAAMAVGGVSARPVEAQAAPPSSKRALKLGFPTYMLKHYTLDKAIEITRRLDVEWICLRSFHLPLESTADEIRAAIAKVKAAGLRPYAGGVITMKTAADVDRAFEYARAAGFELITANPEPALLERIEGRAKEHDLKVAIHNHGPEDKLWPTPLAVYEKIRRLDPRIGICHDTGHTMRTGTDPAAATLEVADRMMDMHLKDVDRPVEVGHSLELGRGVVDIPAVIRALAKIGYQGVVGVEHEKDMQDIVAGLAESTGYARGVIDAVGREVR